MNIMDFLKVFKKQDNSVMGYTIKEIKVNSRRVN